MSWEQLIEHGRKSFADPEFDRRERSYKLTIAGALKKALEAARDEGDWTEALKAAVRRSHAGAHYNLSDWRQHDWLLNLEGDAKDVTRAAVAGFLETDKSPPDRFRAFAEVAERFANKPGSNRGSILAVGSVLNFAAEPQDLPPIKTTVFKFAEDEVGNTIAASSQSIVLPVPAVLA